MRVARIEHDHDELDPEMLGSEYHEWIRDTRNVSEIRTRDGRRNAGGWSRWLLFVCNNPDCGGRAWLQERALDEHAASLIEEVRRG